MPITIVCDTGESLTLEARSLVGIDLREAELHRARLECADLRGAKLARANLRSAVLAGANLSNANLDVARLMVADLSGARLTGATLRGARLNGARLDNAMLDGADLRGATFAHAVLAGASVIGARLTRGALSDSQLASVAHSDSIAWEDTFERVYTVLDYHDGPRMGIADVGGHPHVFESRFDEEKDYYTEWYELRPIDEETLRLSLEAWEIWLRWADAHDRGLVGIETHPALPAERARRDELRALLEPRMAAATTSSVRAIATFRQPPGDARPTRSRSMEVQWTLLE